jgi:hypothetical protein
MEAAAGRQERRRVTFVLFEGVEGVEGVQTRKSQPVFRKLSHSAAFVKRDSSIYQKKMRNAVTSNIYRDRKFTRQDDLAKNRRFAKT